MIRQSKSCHALSQGIRHGRTNSVLLIHNHHHSLSKISGNEFIGRTFSTWNKLLNNNAEEERKKDRKEAQEKMYNIKRELSEFLTAKLDGSKRKEKQEERIKLAQNLGNVMIVAGFIVGLIYYVGENEKKKRIERGEEIPEISQQGVFASANDKGNVSADVFLSSISKKVNQVRENNKQEKE